MSEVSESKLVEKVRRGDIGALGDLLERYQQRLYNVCLRMVGNRDDAAEVTQEAMLKIVEHIHDYHAQSAISTWMTRIVMNLAISHLRRRRVRHAASLDQSPSPGSNSQNSASHSRYDQLTPLRNELADHREPSPSAYVQQQETIAQLHQALQNLDEEFRAVLVLRDVDQMEYAEIAQTLSIPLGTVKSKIFRARLALRQEMLKQENPKDSAASSANTNP